MTELVRLERGEDGVATLSVDRPPVNALNEQVWGELGEAAREIEVDDRIRSVVLWNGAKHFCAGADIKAMKEMSYQGARRAFPSLQAAFTSLAGLPQVTIAAVAGYALGGGCELALTADFRYAAEDSQLGQPEMLLGIIPGAGGTQRLQRVVGLQAAKEMVYGGGMYSAAQCAEMGLVDKVLADADAVYEQALADARRYARGPFAMRLAKKAIDDGGELDLDSALRLETELFATCFATEDRATGMASFLEEGPGKARFAGR